MPIKELVRHNTVSCLTGVVVSAYYVSQLNVGTKIELFNYIALMKHLGACWAKPVKVEPEKRLGVQKDNLLAIQIFFVVCIV